MFICLAPRAPQQCSLCFLRPCAIYNISVSRIDTNLFCSNSAFWVAVAVCGLCLSEKEVTIEGKHEVSITKINVHIV